MGAQVWLEHVKNRTPLQPSVALSDNLCFKNVVRKSEVERMLFFI